jgi:hypothetical protein
MKSVVIAAVAAMALAAVAWGQESASLLLEYGRGDSGTLIWSQPYALRDQKVEDVLITADGFVPMRKYMEPRRVTVRNLDPVLRFRITAQARSEDDGSSQPIIDRVLSPGDSAFFDIRPGQAYEIAYYLDSVEEAIKANPAGGAAFWRSREPLASYRIALASLRFDHYSGPSLYSVEAFGKKQLGWTNGLTLTYSFGTFPLSLVIPKLVLMNNIFAAAEDGAANAAAVAEFLNAGVGVSFFNSVMIGYVWDFSGGTVGNKWVVGFDLAKLVSYVL